MELITKQQQLSIANAKLPVFELMEHHGEDGWNSISGPHTSEKDIIKLKRREVLKWGKRPKLLAISKIYRTPQSVIDIFEEEEIIERMYETQQ